MNSWRVLERGRNLLVNLGNGNPVFLCDVKNGLICLLLSKNSAAQRVAAQGSVMLLSWASPFHANVSTEIERSRRIVDSHLPFCHAGVAMLLNPDLQTQFEGMLCCQSQI